MNSLENSPIYQHFIPDEPLSPGMPRMLPPYLITPPEIIPIDHSSQLFVDDFLIDTTDLKRVWNSASPYPGNPILQPETEIELNDGYCPLACPFNDGVWFDPEDQLYKMWYHAGWFQGTALALSRDGIHWERPQFDVVPGTNLVLPQREGVMRDGALVWLDDTPARADERWKMFLFERVPGNEHGSVLSSPDGIHWEFRSHTGPCGDNTSFYYDPFRSRWVFSVREFRPGIGRMRSFIARQDFFDCAWKNSEPRAWLACDADDRPDSAIGFAPQLYDFNAARYESLMIGLFAIMRGPENDVCAAHGIPKTNDLEIGFSRDGIHWLRPVTSQPFLRASRQDGRWDRGYLHAAGGIWLDDGVQLRFYYAGWSGQSPRLHGNATGPYVTANAMYAGGSTGFATLRRDGFAAMNATGGTGILTTRPLAPQGNELSVNCCCPDGKLRVEVLNAAGVALPGYELSEAVAMTGDATTSRICWRQHDRLPVQTRPLRLRFHLRNGSLYSFRLS